MARPILLLLIALLCLGAASQDSSIEARLKARLSRSKLNSDGLKFQVKDGIVEWSGIVKIPQRKGAATRMAKSAGAKRVVNRIVVQKSNAALPSKQSPRRASVLFSKH
jgi:hypothetical protein